MLLLFHVAPFTPLMPPAAIDADYRRYAAA